MAHNQGNKPTDDPNKFGLKFDSEKPNWDLLPELQVIKIIRVFNEFTPSGKSNNLGFLAIDLKNFDRERLINSIIGEAFSWHMGVKSFNVGTNYCELLTTIGFKILFLLRNKSYTDEELKRMDSLRFDLVNMQDIQAVVDIFTMGAKKYAPNNWKLVNPSRYYGAFMRHFLKIRTKELYDSELGCLHIHQALWNIIVLMWIEDNKKSSSEIKRDIEIKPKQKQKRTPIRNPRSGKD